MAKSKAERLADQVFALLPAGTKTATGRRETAGNHAPPSVIAVPLGAPTIRQPNRPGDARYIDVGRQLLVREFRIEWWCHDAPSDDTASDDTAGLFGEAETLYEKLLLAVRTVAHHSVEFSDERWIDQEEGSDSYDRHGTTIVVMSVIAIPVYEPRTKTVTLQSQAQIVTTAVLNDEQES